MQDFYQQRANNFKDKYDHTRQEANGFSLLRGFAFILSAAFFIVYFQTGNWLSLGGGVVIGIGFYLLVSHHRKLQALTEYFSQLVKINEDEIRRLNMDLSGLENGEQFLVEDHPYQADLDIFGDSSLHQLINRCQLEESKEMLASWLSGSAAVEEIRSRQEAVQELSADIDWCQDFEVNTKIEINKKQKNHPHISQEDIVNWAKAPTSFAKPRLWTVLSIILNVIAVSLTMLVILDLYPYQILYAPLIINGVFLGISLKYLRQVTRGVDKSYYLIAAYQKAIVLIESRAFTSEKLKKLHDKLRDQSHAASKSISRLANLTHRLNSRANMLYGLLDIFFLLDAYLLTDLWKWRKENHAEIEGWLETINEMECLISMAGFAHQNPDYCFPKLENTAFHFKATRLGHPLIPSGQKVRNDFEVDGEGSVDIITGSNMSGKSTFQRTVGINMVLAQMGAPVDAESLVMSPAHVFTSMRTKDNLKENTSSFYAELKRLHQLLEAIETQDATFFLLDEILKGTNSEDRHNGAIALAKKLTQKKAFGMISTHDLALGSLEKTEEKIRNFSFNSEIHGDEIIFDYKLTPGICRSFNASKLMQKMGIM